jgi:hypothetical protein
MPLGPAIGLVTDADAEIAAGSACPVAVDVDVADGAANITIAAAAEMAAIRALKRMAVRPLNSPGPR